MSTTAGDEPTVDVDLHKVSFEHWKTIEFRLLFTKTDAYGRNLMTLMTPRKGYGKTKDDEDGDTSMLLARPSSQADDQAAMWDRRESAKGKKKKPDANTELFTTRQTKPGEIHLKEKHHIFEHTITEEEGNGSCGVKCAHDLLNHEKIHYAGLASDTLQLKGDCFPNGLLEGKREKGKRASYVKYTVTLPETPQDSKHIDVIRLSAMLHTLECCRIQGSNGKGQETSTGKQNPSSKVDKSKQIPAGTSTNVEVKNTLQPAKAESSVNGQSPGSSPDVHNADAGDKAAIQQPTHEQSSQQTQRQPREQTQKSTSQKISGNSNKGKGEKPWYKSMFGR
ncbi:MAG: hypothetical protein Q9162_002025 [Coniocarpon cinnabarinum]